MGVTILLGHWAEPRQWAPNPNSFLSFSFPPTRSLALPLHAAFEDPRSGSTAHCLPRHGTPLVTYRPTPHRTRHPHRLPKPPQRSAPSHSAHRRRTRVALRVRAAQFSGGLRPRRRAARTQGETGSSQKSCGEKIIRRVRDRKPGFV